MYQMSLAPVILCGLVAMCAMPWSSKTYCRAEDSDSASTNVAHYSRCDPVVIARIYKHWKKLHLTWPTDIMKKAESNGVETVIFTTPDYYGKNMTCLSSRIQGYSLTTTSVYNNGECATKNMTLKECEGRTISENEGVRVYRFHVVQDKKGVTGIYTCVDCGVSQLADDKPDGFVKISSDCVDEAAISSCLKVMESVGIKMEVKYPRECPRTACC